MELGSDDESLGTGLNIVVKFSCIQLGGVKNKFRYKLLQETLVHLKGNL